jgi:FtsP/CotA-like multicopper oxidase with cupredoxin domain
MSQGKFVNGRVLNKDEYFHKVAFGSVVECELDGVTANPYHQHVYPFQLITGYEDRVSTARFEDTENNDKE